MKAFHHQTIKNLDEKNKTFQAQLDEKKNEINRMATRCNEPFADEDERKKYLDETLAKFKADEAVYKAIAEDTMLEPEKLKEDNIKKQAELDELKLKVEAVTKEDNLKRQEL